VEEALQAEMSKMKSREMSSDEDEPVMESRIVRRKR